MYSPSYLAGISPGSGDLKSELLSELRSYLKLDASQVSDDALYETCQGGTDAILSQWRSRKIDPKDVGAVSAFYEETPLYCYELIGFEINTPEHRQKQLEQIAALLKSQGKLHGCDYGSGVGTLGIYLNKNGVRCDFADVSAVNLGFVAQRLERRGIQGCRRYNLTREDLPEQGYDFITAFDVLEHVTDPLATLRKISSKLKPGGLLIFNVLIEKEEDTPHLLRDPDLIRKNIRALGLGRVSSIGEFKVYRKIARPAWLNGLVGGFDRAFWDLRATLKGGR